MVSCRKVKERGDEMKVSDLEVNLRTIGGDGVKP